MDEQRDLLAIRRNEFVDALQTAVDQAHETESNLGLLLIDLSNIARINHTQGFAVGDRLLVVAHRELLAMSKLPDTVFRTGGHSFCFLLPGLGNPALIALAINKASTALQAALVTEQPDLGIDINIGIAVNIAGGMDCMSTLTAAEVSLAQVKSGGSHGLEDLLQQQSASLTEDYQLESAFRRALRENSFDLYFQPKVNLRDATVDGAEALLRWKSEEFGDVPPEKIISLGVTTGNTYELSKWIVHAAMRQLKSWQSDWPLGIAINIQAEMVSGADLVPLLTDASAIWGVEKEKVTIEITENAIIEDKEAGFSNLVQIRDCGMRVSIDDFGTGYSSLSYFKQIPACELKIDKSFVQSLLSDARELELVKIMIQIAREFDMKVVAEGVEDRQVLALLRNLGCDYGQGYLFARPMPAEKFIDWLQEWSQRNKHK